MVTDADITTALIAGGAALGGAIIGHVIVPYIRFLNERYRRKQSVYERYAQPLAQSSVSLYYRLREIVIQKRYSFLQSNIPKSKFNSYKYISTIYRVAELIGWLRAVRLEHSYWFHPESTNKKPIRESLLFFESSLADGPHVEMYLLRNLCTIWNIPVSENSEEIQLLAARIDAPRHEATLTRDTSDVVDFSSLPSDQRREVLERVSAIICDTVNVRRIPETVIEETLERASNILSVKQAWIYRDWQKAIGDLMLQPIDNASRRFSTIGFGDFEELYYDDNKWIRELENVVRDVNFDVDDPSDFRREQLLSIMRAVCKLILALNTVKIESELIPDDTLRSVRHDLKALEGATV